MPTETKTTAPARTLATPAAAPSTLNALLAHAAQRRGEKLALRRKTGAGTWEDITWARYRETARQLGLGLMSLGLKAGDRVAILANSRVEWVYADMAVLGAGGVAVPIYQNVREDEAGYIIHDAGARFVFVEDLDQLQKIAKARALPECGGLAGLERAVCFDLADTKKTKRADISLADGFVLSLAEVLEKGKAEAPDAFEARSAAARPDDLITLVYTSGTTGRPKGVMLTHGNAVAECHALENAMSFGDDDVVLSFLPLAHIFARCVHWGAIGCGYATAYTSIEAAGEDMKVVRPTCVPSVPRFFEKIHGAVMKKVEAEAPLKKKYVKAALRWALEADRRYRKGLGLGPILAVKRLLATPAVSKIAGGLREKTGGRLRMFISGGAPLSKEIAEFLHSLGFLILEGYGLTETTAGTHVNRIGRYKLGTVGPAVPDLETRIAPDGEILVRGPIIMKGYYNKPEATREALDADGWFRTGDIGELDDDGFLRITDRKKDLIKTAGGKYVAPQNLENLMKTIPGVSQIAVFGDQRKYVTALVAVDIDAAKRIISEAGGNATSELQEIIRHQAVEKQIAAGIAARNAELPSYETIKYFRIVPKDFEVGDELTPTLKVKRKHVAEKYKTLIEEMYVER